MMDKSFSSDRSLFAESVTVYVKHSRIKCMTMRLLCNQSRGWRWGGSTLKQPLSVEKNMDAVTFSGEPANFYTTLMFHI